MTHPTIAEIQARYDNAKHADNQSIAAQDVSFLLAERKRLEERIKVLEGKKV